MADKAINITNADVNISGGLNLFGGLDVYRNPSSGEACQGGILCLHGSDSYKNLFIDNRENWLRLHDGTNVWFYVNTISHATFSNSFTTTWGNDFAEYRKSEISEPGRVVVENGDGWLSISTERLQRGASIISDTFGNSVGMSSEELVPIAVAGRVLAYYSGDISDFKPGTPVCSGPDGTVSVMTEDEEEKYSSRILGFVSELPTYDVWGDELDSVRVNGRIWIKVK